MDDSVNPVANDYRVDLAVFQGPLDLLLYLIRKEEVDLRDIPVSKITRQYLQYIELMKTLNLEIVGEYLLMAATLIHIKTRMLLPRTQQEAEEFDPREELVMALMEYKKYREASELLREKALLEERNYVPPSPVGKVQGKIEIIPATKLFDLIIAFKEVFDNKKKEKPHEVITEEITIEDRMTYVLQSLEERESATFKELFADIPRKIVAVVTFIALLELCRARRVVLNQSLPFEELRVYRGENFYKSALAIDLVEVKPETEEILP